MARRQFLAALEERRTENPAALLMDVNTHEFDSFACLKLLCDLDSNETVDRYISRAAFVLPRRYLEMTRKNPGLAFFDG